MSKESSSSGREIGNLVESTTGPTPHRSTPKKRPLQTLERPSVVVDLVVLTVMDADLKVLLHKRQQQPFQGFPLMV
mgnify:CR=1 FL=1